MLTERHVNMLLPLQVDYLKIVTLSSSCIYSRKGESIKCIFASYCCVIATLTQCVTSRVVTLFNEKLM